MMTEIKRREQVKLYGAHGIHGVIRQQADNTWIWHIEDALDGERVLEDSVVTYDADNKEGAVNDCRINMVGYIQEREDATVRFFASQS